MKKILILLPKSIAGELIMNGFASGFELKKCKVLKKCIDEITSDDLKNFKPDIIMGYDYSFLMDDTCKKIIEKSDCKNLVCYFADEPKGDYSHGPKKDLYKELKKFKPKIFIWDSEFLDDFEDSEYLPLAINPMHYFTDFSGYKYSISFVGRPLSDIRQEILCELVKVFKNKLNIFCYEKHFNQSVEQIEQKGLLDVSDLEIYKKCWRGFAKNEAELAQIYCSSKINLNINLQGKSSINYRVFEVLASGGFLLTDEREDIFKYFDVSKQLETYKNTRDLIDKIEFYLNNLNIAQKIAQLGRFEVVEKHTFAARAGFVLKKVV